jgi:hypothetical protein
MSVDGRILLLVSRWSYTYIEGSEWVRRRGPEYVPNNIALKEQFAHHTFVDPIDLAYLRQLQCTWGARQ